MAGGSGRARGAGSRAAPNRVPRGCHARSPNLCGGLSPLLCARMGALFALLGLVVCWPAFRHACGGGSRANTNGTALQHSAKSDGDACAADARPAFQHKPSTANVRRGRYGDERSPPQTRTTSAPRDVMTTRLRGGPPRGRARASAPGPTGGTLTARLCQAVAWTPHPHRGKGLGEATHPGPPDIGEAVRRRERAWHALAQMQLLPPHTSPLQREDNGAGSETDAAVTLSDTLSAATPFASPRGEHQAELSGAMAPMAPGEATPWFSAPRSLFTGHAAAARNQCRAVTLARCSPTELSARRAQFVVVRSPVHAHGSRQPDRAPTKRGGLAHGSALASASWWPCCATRRPLCRQRSLGLCSRWPNVTHDGARQVMQEDVETATALTCPTRRCHLQPRLCFAWRPMAT